MRRLLFPRPALRHALEKPTAAPPWAFLWIIWRGSCGRNSPTFPGF